MKLPKVGSLVVCSFLDHCEDGDEPMPCFVMGRLVKKAALYGEGRKRRYIVIHSWFFREGTDEAVVEENAKPFTILYSACDFCFEVAPSDPEQARMLATALAEQPPRRNNG